MTAERCGGALERFHPGSRSPARSSRRRRVLLDLLFAGRADGARVRARHAGAVRGDLRRSGAPTRSATARRSRCPRRAGRRTGLWDTRPGRLLRRSARSAARPHAAPGSTPGSPACGASSRRRASDIARPSWDAKHGLWKFNPLADWTERDVWALHRRSRAALQPVARPGLRLDRLHALHAAGSRPRRSLGGEREDRMRAARLTPLEHLESEAVHVMREMAAERERPALLFSAARTRSCCCGWPRRRSVPGASRSRCCTSTPATTSPR